MQEIMQDNKLIIPVELIGKFYRENREEAVRFLNTAADFLHRTPEVFGEQSAPYVDFLYSLWITNVIDEIAAGRLFISEETLNRLAKSLITGYNVRFVDINCYGSGVLDLEVEHTRIGKFLLSGRILSWRHNSSESQAVISVDSIRSSGADHGIGKLFANVTMSVISGFLSSFLNRVIRGVKLSYSSNILTVDFSGLISSSAFGRKQIGGHPLSGYFTIDGAKVVEKGIELSVGLNRGLVPFLRNTGSPEEAVFSGANQ